MHKTLKTEIISLFPVLILFVLFILDKIKMSTSIYPILFLTIILFVFSLVEKKIKKDVIEMDIPILDFLWKLSILFYFFFYTVFIFKNTWNIENTILLILALLPMSLKVLLLLSYKIKEKEIRKKYSIKKEETFYKILNLKRLVITNKEQKQKAIKIKYLFSSHKKIKKIDPILKKAISLFYTTKEDKMILKSLSCKEKKKEIKKISTNKVIFENKIYRKGIVPTLLKQATHTIKNNRKIKLNQSSRNYILKMYQACLKETDKIIGYAYEENKKIVFIGFVGMKIQEKTEFKKLNEKIEIISKKEKNTDFSLEELEIKDLKKFYDLLQERNIFLKNKQKAVLFYFLNKTILTISILFSFSIDINLLSIPSLLFFEFIFLPILFFEITFFPKQKKIKKSIYIIDTIIKSVFSLFFVLAFFPYFKIHTIRYLFFFFFLIQQILSVYSYVLANYTCFFKEKYLNVFLLLLGILLLCIYKTNLLCLSFFAIVFVLCLEISFYLFLEIVHQIIEKKE